jgi:hypothetical protein
VTSNLNELTTEELRRLAFDKAQADHDLHFFWDLVKHLRASRVLAAEDGSSGGIAAGIAELVDMARELMGKDLGNDEPLLRARFLDYLRA